MTLNFNRSDIIRVVFLNAAGGKIISSMIETPKTAWWEISHINKAVEATYGIPARVVRCLSGDTNEVACSERTYAVEFVGINNNHYQDGLIADLDSLNPKLDLESLASLRELLEARRSSIRTRLISCEPWVKRSWQDEMESFVFGAISNVKTPGTCTQLRCWPRSNVYEIWADAVRYIFKACPPTYAVEPVLTQYLSKNYPSLVAEVKAVEAKSGFLLSVAFNGKETVTSDIKSLKAAACGLAKIQVAEANDLSKLTHLGVVSQDYQKLKDSILTLLGDHSALMVEKKGGLTALEFNKFKETKGLLISAVSRLQTIGVPLSLEHGDFRAANILCNDSHSCRIIDWSEAVISHPFFSLAQLLDEEDYAQDLCSAVQIKGQIALAYFNPWLDAGFEKAHLEEALHLARLLMPIAKGIERRERLIPSLADATSWTFSVTYWVRRFLLRLDSTDMLAGCDSGSVVLEKGTRKPVGLLCAASKTTTNSNHMPAVNTAPSKTGFFGQHSSTKKQGFSTLHPVSKGAKTTIIQDSLGIVMRAIPKLIRR